MAEADSITKEEVVKVLSLLESYHEKLNKPQDAAVQKAIEKVIRVFRTKSFTSLIDIQQYYRELLVNGTQESIPCSVLKEEPSQKQHHSNENNVINGIVEVDSK